MKLIINEFLNNEYPLITQEHLDILKKQLFDKTPYLLFIGTYQITPKPKDLSPKFPFFIASLNKLKNRKKTKFEGLLSHFSCIDKGKFKTPKLTDIAVEILPAEIKFVTGPPSLFFYNNSIPKNHLKNDSKQIFNNSSQQLYVGIQQMIDYYTRKHFHGVFGNYCPQTDDFSNRGIFEIREYLDNS
jgi:hypothetical protein